MQLCTYLKKNRNMLKLNDRSQLHADNFRFINQFYFLYNRPYKYLLEIFKGDPVARYEVFHVENFEGFSCTRKFGIKLFYSMPHGGGLNNVIIKVFFCKPPDFHISQ